MEKVLLTITIISLSLIMPAKLTAQENKQLIDTVIQKSIGDYKLNHGPCPCPYNINRANRKCGKSSAYIRAGGQAPKCFPKDVTAEDLQKLK